MIPKYIETCIQPPMVMIPISAIHAVTQTETIKNKTHQRIHITIF